MKIATAAYTLDFLTSWAEYEDKIARWVEEASSAGAELAVFPEYGAMELATLEGREVAADLQLSTRAVSDRLPDADRLHSALAQQYGMHILAASGPVITSEGTLNRARIFAPNGQAGQQDKQIMTRYERDIWDIVGGGPLQVFDTALGRIGVLICYDSEFPLLGRALSDCDLILVPSCTEALAGYWRVRIGAMARALENQCITVMSSMVGEAAWSEAVETTIGAGGVFGPSDIGFPPTGVLAEGTLGQPGWTFANVDLGRIEQVRADGIVLGRSHWPEQIGREGPATIASLR